MNLRQFYETVIFRDLVNHTLPGSVALIGVGMVGGAVISRLDLVQSLSDFLLTSGAFGNNAIVGIVVLSDWPTSPAMRSVHSFL